MNCTSSNYPYSNRPSFPAHPLSYRRNQWPPPNHQGHRTSVVLKLRIHWLRKPWIRLLHNPYTRPSPRTIPSPRSRPPNNYPRWIPHPSSGLCRGRLTLLSSPLLGRKNRCSARPTKPDSLHHISPRRLLRAVLRNLRRKPQLHAHCSWSSPAPTIWRLIYPNTPRCLAKKLNWA